MSTLWQANEMHPFFDTIQERAFLPERKQRGLLPEDTMNTRSEFVNGQSRQILEHPFPATRPDVHIVESGDSITEVDCPELQWWFTVPQMGEPYFWAGYDARTKKLVEVKEIIPLLPATVCGIDCIELEVKQWAAEDDSPTGPYLMYATLEADTARWIAIVNMLDGRKIVDTVRDDYFECDWGGAERRCIVDDGRYQRQSDGTYNISNGQGRGAGTYAITIGENTFHCLRVLDVDSAEPDGGTLNEVFIRKDGRTVLHRRYVSRYAQGQDFAEKFPNNRRLVINDTVYVQGDFSGRAHDDITQIALCPQ